MKLGIIKTDDNLHLKYVKACIDLNIEYEIIDFFANDWVELINNSGCDGFLLRPNVKKQYFKDAFDERVFFLNKILGKKIYPSYDEIFIYENKHNMALWLNIHNIKHAKTHIFYNKKEALYFINGAEFPIVFKTKIGSAGIGVEFLKSKRRAKKLIRKVFPSYPPFSLPFINRGYSRVVKSKRFPLLRSSLRDDKQYGVVLFQEKLTNLKCEWRMIKIGDSYFGHQKIADKTGKHSGSSLVNWAKPPITLLELVKEICELGNFNSMNVDVFETESGEYYVNELQTIFGSYDNSQMYIDGKPGRYRYINNEWIFEEGYFNQNSSMNLRVKDFINILGGKNE